MPSATSGLSAAILTRLGFPLLAFLLLTGCSSNTIIRKAGQTELFMFVPENNTFLAPHDYLKHPLPWIQNREQVDSKWGDRVRFASDVLMISVDSVYIADKPGTLTNSSDVLLFAEIWENAADGGAEKSLTFCLPPVRNQLIPGRMNFKGAIAYGPTNFKGSPLRIRFTLMILQKERGKDQASVADVVSKYTSAIPNAGAFVSPAAGVIRDVLRAQPDVIAFDYDAVLVSDRPEKLSPTLMSLKAVEAATGGSGKIASIGGIDSAAIKALDDEAKRIAAADKKIRDQWDSWQRSFGWMQYGQYAIVETASARPASTSTTSVGGMRNGRAAAASSPVQEPEKNVYSRKAMPVLYSRGGWLLTNPEAAGESDLASSYVIFSIVPGQLAQDAGTLRAASAAAVERVTAVSQTKDNITSALTTIDQAAKDLKYAVVKSRAENLADKIAKTPDMTYGTFKSRFGSQYSDLLDSFGKLPNDLPENAVKEIRSTIESRYQSIFEEIKKGEIVSPEKVAFTARVKALADLLDLQGVQLATIATDLEKIEKSRVGATVSDEALKAVEAQEGILKTAMAAAKAPGASVDTTAALTTSLASAQVEADKATLTASTAQALWEKARADLSTLNSALGGIAYALTSAAAQQDALTTETKNAARVAATKATAAADTGNQSDFAAAQAAAENAAAFQVLVDDTAKSLKPKVTALADAQAISAKLREVTFSPADTEWLKLIAYTKAVQNLVVLINTASRP